MSKKCKNTPKNRLRAKTKKKLKSFASLSDTTFVRLADFSDGFSYDLRYATKNNFLKEKVYDCAECYTRVKTAKALIAANKELEKKEEEKRARGGGGG